MPIFAHSDQKSSVLGTIITNPTEHGDCYAILISKNIILKVEIH